jgi:hypothetical protein
MAKKKGLGNLQVWAGINVNDVLSLNFDAALSESPLTPTYGT